MREIIFRGKRIDNGEWVQSGNIIHFNNEGANRLFFIPKYNDKCVCVHDDDDNILSIEEGTFYKVIPETVGQYTGLTDKNGTKIFEWDIVKITDTIVDFETTAYIEFGNPNGQYNWGWQLVPLQKKPFAIEILHWVEMEETGAFIEVIGNIHDNPELLKKE